MEVVLACCEVAEEWWISTVEEEEQEKIEETVSFMLLTFGAVLRGEEAPLVSLKGLLQFWEEATSH